MEAQGWRAGIKEWQGSKDIVFGRDFLYRRLEVVVFRISHEGSKAQRIFPIFQSL